MNRQCWHWMAVVILFLIFLGGCGRPSAVPSGTAGTAAGVRVITDMAGRKVVVPQEIRKVYPVSPVEAVLLYTLAPELLVGWGYHMGADQSGYILPAYRELPVIGWINRGSTGNLEEVMKIKPDVILLVDEISPTSKAFADELEQLTQIPVVLLDKGLTSMEQTYLAAGKVLNREARAGELAAYCRETLGLIQEKKAVAAQGKPVSVYYAEGRRGLETEPRGSWHAEVIEFVGGVNAAEPGLPSSGAIGRSPVSLEQVITWNPDVILVGYFRDGESSSFPSIMEEQAWQGIRAVANRQVYEIPTGPFNWFDRPPAVSRLIGLRWVANLLYPEVYPFDFRTEVKRFYALFYQYQLSEQELDELAARAQRK